MRGKYLKSALRQWLDKKKRIILKMKFKKIKIVLGKTMDTRKVEELLVKTV